MDHALKLAGAPPELIDWVIELDVLEPWHSCPKAEWMVWLIACGGLPVEDILTAMRFPLEDIVASLPGRHAEPLALVLKRLRDGDLSEIAPLLDRIEATSEAGSYRAGPAQGHAHAARAVAFLGRAYEAFRGVVDQVVADDAREALAQGTAPRPLGKSVFMPLHLESDPTQHTLGFVLTAAAEAAHEAALALAASEDEEAIAVADEELVDRIRHLLAL